jgi:two-component sensor histidine kinase
VLPSEAAVPIGMAIHELTTNAAKHGALLTQEGPVDVRWSVDHEGEQPMLNLAWTERGGPPVARPVRQGFGSRLIQRVLTAQLQAEVHVAYEPGGIRFRLSMPVPDTPALFDPSA